MTEQLKPTGVTYKRIESELRRYYATSLTFNIVSIEPYGGGYLVKHGRTYEGCSGSVCTEDRVAFFAWADREYEIRCKFDMIAN